jgi:predicted lipoprotein
VAADWYLQVVALAALYGCDVVTVRPLKEGDASVSPEPTTTQTFDADAFVAKVWPERLLPAITGRAVEFPTALAQLTQSDEAAFPVARVRGRVVSVEARGRSRGVVLDVQPPDGSGDVWMQIGGPGGVDGAAVRDASGVLSFDQFPNQMEFARVASSLGRHIESVVIRPALPALKPGAEVSAIGPLFRKRGATEADVALVPAILSVAGATP